MANEFDSKLYILNDLSNDISYRLIRYPYLMLKTLLVLRKEKPTMVFAQNPSIMLASFLCLLKGLFKYKLIVDRHSNFFLETFHSKNIKWKIFHKLSVFSVTNADLTIVSNNYLCKLVHLWGGNGFTLPDKLPELTQGELIPLKGEKNIVFISSFDGDEPVIELFNAAREINSNWIVYVTGNYLKYKDNIQLMRSMPDNIILTGFLPEKEYQSLLMSADLLVILTKQDHTLTCGTYEGISLIKPMVVSDTAAIRDYFYKGVVYSDPEYKSISAAIEAAISKSTKLKEEIIHLKTDLMEDWDKRFNNLCKIIENL